MSFDVFLQAFANGDSWPGRPAAAMEALAPLLATSAPRDGWACLRTGDGEADVYGIGGDCLMVNHASGTQVWDLLVSAARAADWVIMPVGCHVCVPTADAISHLPEELQEGVVLVATGQDLIDAIHRA